MYSLKVVGGFHTLVWAAALRHQASALLKGTANDAARFVTFNRRFRDLPEALS